MKRNFVMTQNHITLLNNSYTTWNDGYSDMGVAGIDSKRPYGNSNIIVDIHELLTGETVDEDKLEDQGIDYDEFIEGLHVKYDQLHKETATALQIVLHTQSFELGEYSLDGYGKNWVKA